MEYFLVKSALKSSSRRLYGGSARDTHAQPRKPLARPIAALNPSYAIHPEDSQPSVLSILPTEILLEITAHLPLSSIANLALTSRRMLHRMRHADPFTAINTPGNEYQRALFLENFDSKYPDHVLCHACGVFHSRPISAKAKRFSKQNGHKYRKYERDMPCGIWKKNYGREFIRLNEKVYRWMDFHLVMRAFKHSQLHGAAYALNKTKLLGTYKHWISNSLAVLVDGRLLVREKWSVGIRADTQKRIPFEDCFYICSHLRKSGEHEKIQGHLKRAVECVRVLPESALTIGFLFKKQRCTKCPSEYTIDVQPGTQFQGRLEYRQRSLPYVLSLNRYLDIGACMRPDCLEWQSLSFYGRNKDRPSIDVTYKEPISTRFERWLMEQVTRDPFDPLKEWESAVHGDPE